MGAVGLVASGAGARGAYEAGALSVVLPCLEQRGSPPSVLVGTSAGALNVVGLASLLDGSPTAWTEAAQQLVQLWSGVHLTEVTSLPRSLLGDAAGYVRQFLGLGGRLPSLLDTTAMRATLERLIDFDRVHENIEAGPVDAVAVAATAAADGSTVVFVERKPSVALPQPDPARNITYVDTILTVEHVLASAAVPAAFRPVAVPPTGGWFVDGGVRLNTPLKPALDLGCDRLAVVSTHPATWPPASQQQTADGAPDVFAAGALVLQSLLNDRTIEDLRALARVNTLLGAGASVIDYREVHFVLACPPRMYADALGELAREVGDRHDGAGAVVRDLISDRDLGLLARLVGTSSIAQGELLSFLLFDGEFTRPAAQLGVAHAEQVLGTCADGVPWRTTLS